jgi:hypothetical protein
VSARRLDPAMLGTSGYERRQRDSYYTQAWVTEALVSQVELRNTLWEPAAGRGDMTAVLRDAGYRVTESDIAWSESFDFMRQQSLPGGGQVNRHKPAGQPDRGLHPLRTQTGLRGGRHGRNAGAE